MGFIKSYLLLFVDKNVINKKNSKNGSTHYLE